MHIEVKIGLTTFLLVTENCSDAVMETEFQRG